MYSENVLGIGALNEGEALANLLDALSIAEESARQLALYTNQTHWMLAANKFGGIRHTCAKLAAQSLSHSQ